MHNLSSNRNKASPAFPERFTLSDTRVISLALAASKQLAQPFSGEFKASWLLSDYSATRWETTNRNREEQVNGQWRNAISIDWALRLPNGELLTAVKYRKLLDLIKRVAFLMRSGYLGAVPNPITWRADVAVFLNLARWVVLNEAQYHPEKYGFKLLDQSAIDSLMRMIAGGGWTSALQYPQRLLSILYKGAFGKSCPRALLNSAYQLPDDVKAKITTWLAENDYYKPMYRGQHFGKRYLRRQRLADAIGESGEIFVRTPRMNAFCRQFENDFLSNGLLIATFQETEMPSHKTKTIDEVISGGVSESTLSGVSKSLTILFSAYRHAQDELPSPAQISVVSAQSEVTGLTRPGGHTRFIPVNTGLAYLNSAMRFVHVYGESIIGYYLAVVTASEESSEQVRSDALVSIMGSRTVADRFQVGSAEGSKPIATVLGIRQFQRSGTSPDLDMLRRHPTLDEMLRVLIGACVVCIGILKPSRAYELTHLKRDCLREDGSGYHLHYALGKSNVGEAYIEIDRPIPFISAKAIRLLQKLGVGLSELFPDDRKISGNLFYLPKLEGGGALEASEALLNTYLDTFCDYIGLPPDHMGRRWYVRIHEMRKWFLLLLFWSGRYDVLDAARWIAGHIDAAHIYEYIEREFPGEELPKLEAEYAVERLRALESTLGTTTQHESGINSLYERVLKHFCVKSLSMIPEPDWADYVAALREKEGFILEPHSVHVEGANGDVMGIEVSFVIREEST